MAKKSAKTEQIRIKLVRSLIGSKKDQIDTATSLGLRKLGSTVVQPDNAATRGKVTKIVHLVEVTQV